MAKQRSLEDFFITDPDQQPGVVERVPEGVEPAEPLDGYYSDKLVRCSFCRQRQKHRKGIFVRLSDGSTALCGHCCAVDLFSKTEIARIERALEKKIVAQEKRAASEALSIGIPEALKVLEPLLDLERDIREFGEFVGEDVPFFQKYQHAKDLGIAVGGLRTIVKVTDAGVTDSGVEEVVKKRAQVRERVEVGLDRIDQAKRDFSYFGNNLLMTRMTGKHDDCKVSEVKVDGGTLYYQLEKWHGEFSCEIPVPKIEVPDRNAILALLS